MSFFGLEGFEREMLAIAVLTASACALPGALLVLRRMALVSDAISHTVVLGIVLAYFATHDLRSPWLMAGAALSGVATVWLIELLTRSGRVKEDAAIGLVFPALFSLAVILITKYASSVHLDTDAVLLGELVFAPGHRLVLAGIDLPYALWTTGGLLLLNSLFVALLHKELKLASFDAGLAAALGFLPGLLHYGLVSLVSLTAVGCFDAVGAVLVVALMIASPATAFLLTRRYERMLLLSVAAGAASAVAGFALAKWLDLSISGCMALMSGALFTLALVFAPQRGLLAQQLLRRRQRWQFAQDMLLVHLLTHAGTAEEAAENTPEQIPLHLHWPAQFAQRVIELAQAAGRIQSPQGRQRSLQLTPAGERHATRLRDGLRL